MIPKVSVVIPVYNVEKYIACCLDSLLDQTLRSIEIICVDDGSTDATPEILARLASEHENLRVIRQENAGSSVARNRGLECATGEYVHFLDSDDYLSRPDAYERLYERASALKLDEIYFTGDCVVDEGSKDFIDAMAHSLLFRGTYDPDAVLDGQSMFVLLRSSNDFMPPAWRRLYRREFLMENRLRFIEGIVHQDVMFATECLSLASRVACWDFHCYAYRIRANSVMTSKKRQPYKSLYAILTGSRALMAFQRDRLASASPAFLAAYRAYLRDMLRRNVKEYLDLPPRARRAFWDWTPEERRSELRRWMCVDVIRETPNILKRSLKRRVSPALWARFKRIKSSFHNPH